MVNLKKLILQSALLIVSPPPITTIVKSHHSGDLSWAAIAQWIRLRLPSCKQLLNLV